MFDSPFNSPFIVPVAAMAAWVIVTWIRAKHGISGPSWHRQRNMDVPPMFQKMMDKSMEERDAEIQSLKERIEVLEKIVTDSHASNSLSEEIERLRDRK